MSRAPVPASMKKQIGKYLMAAKSFKKISPVAALYCKLYSLEIAKAQYSNDTKAYILQLADDCIAEKDALNPTPEDAKSAIRAMGATIFKNVYSNESSMSPKQAAKGYRDCFVCFEILKHPNLKDTMSEGEMEIYKQNAKYLTFKTAAAMNPSIVKDEPPPAPPGLKRLLDGDADDNGGGDEDDDDALMKELENMEMDNAGGGDPWASFNSYQDNTTDNTGNKNDGNDNSNLNSNDMSNDLNMGGGGGGGGGMANPSDDLNGNSNNNSNDMNNMGNMGNMGNNGNGGNMGNMGNMGNPYYGNNMGNPYYGGGGAPGGPGAGPGGATAPEDPSATMGSAQAPADGGDGGDDFGSLPSPPESKPKPQAKPQAKKQPSFQDLTQPLPSPKYQDAGMDSAGGGGDGVDYSAYVKQAAARSEETKLWSNVQNGQKYQNECVKTLDQATYCLMLGEPDFRGALDIAAKAQKMVNLCRRSVGLPEINLPMKPPNDVPANNVGNRTTDWWRKPIGSKKFFKLQELSFEAETRLKKVKRHIGRSEMPAMETFVLLAEALSYLHPIAAIQPAWE